MSKDRFHRLTQTALCLLCAASVWRYGSLLEGTEFSGGRLTGPLLLMKDIGALLFVLAIGVTFFHRKTAATVAVVASLLCFPLYFYSAAPGPFRWLFRAEYSVPLPANFVWDTWTMFGLALIATTTFISLNSLLTPKDSNPPA